MDTSKLATLNITGLGPDENIPLKPSGMVLGRDKSCQISLDSPRISRKHARIYRDPFGRWLIEDLGSRNGIWLGSQRIKTQAILPGETVTMGPYSLTISEPSSAGLAAPSEDTDAPAAIIENSMEGGPLAAANDTYDAMSGVRLKQLNTIIDRLGGLSDANKLYPELCRSLARTPESVAMILRMPAGSTMMKESPQVIAHHFGGSAPLSVNFDTSNLHISRRVMDAVRSTGKSVMASSSSTSEDALSLTIVDDRKPRGVLCSPLGEADDMIDVFYLDIPSVSATSEMLDFVQAVVRQVSFIRKSLLLGEARAERRVLDRQIQLAREIQANLTPTHFQNIPTIDTAIYYKPAMWVGGDYCDRWALEDGRMAFVIGDVSGKGLAAAMVMSNLQAALRMVMSFCPQPAEAMCHLDRHLSESIPEHMFVTMFLGVFDPNLSMLEYVNAGHILPIVLRADGTSHELGVPSNPPIGLSVGNFESTSETIEPNAGIVVVTDGITESMSPEGDEFGPQRLVVSLADKQDRSADEVIEIVSSGAADFRNDMPQQDDVTIFVLRNTAQQPAN